MDFKTKPTSRKDLRAYAKVLRKLFNVPEKGKFPVLEILERLEDVFPNTTVEIVDDSKLNKKTMAHCFLNTLGGYTIEIKESVYNDAYYKNKGAALGFICHEICHVFLFSIGFTPLHERSFGDCSLRAFESVEWQAKALCAEVMIPYEESKNMTAKQIVDKYCVSKSFAGYRKNLGRK